MGAGLSFAYAFLAFLLSGEVLIEMRSGGVETFELKERAIVVLVDTNTGLGSSPGIIDAEKGVRLFDPDGKLCVLNPEGYGNHYRRFGEYNLIKTGTYRLEIDEVEGPVESEGSLITRGKLPGLAVAVWSGLALGILAIPVAILGGLALLVTPKKKDPE